MTGQDFYICRLCRSSQTQKTTQLRPSAAGRTLWLSLGCVQNLLNRSQIVFQNLRFSSRDGRCRSGWKTPQETLSSLVLEAGAACGVSILSRVTCEANAGSHSLSFHGSMATEADLSSPVLPVLFVAQAESQEDQRIGTTHDLDIASMAWATWVWLNLTSVIQPHEELLRYNRITKRVYTNIYRQLYTLHNLHWEFVLK